MGRLEINHGPVALNRRAARFGRKINHQLSEGFRGITGGTGPDVYIDWRKFSQGLDPRENPLLYSMYALTVLSLMTIPTMALVDDVGDHHDGIGTNMHPQYAEKSAANDNAPPVISELPPAPPRGDNRAFSLPSSQEPSSSISSMPDSGRKSIKEQEIQIGSVVSVGTDSREGLNSLVEAGFDLRDARVEGDRLVANVIASPDLMEKISSMGNIEFAPNADASQRLMKSGEIGLGVGAYIPGEMLVQLNDDAQIDLLSSMAGVETKYVSRGLKIVKVIIPEKSTQSTADLFNQLKDSGLYKRVSFNWASGNSQEFKQPNDPLYADEDFRWPFRAINAEEAWDHQTYGGVVGIMDGGGALSDEADLINNIADSHDVTTGSNDPEPLGCSINHGRLVTSVAAAEGNNGLEYTGMMWNGEVFFVNMESVELGIMCVYTLEHQISALEYLKEQGVEIAGSSIGLSLLTSQSGFEMYSEAASAFILDTDGTQRAVFVVAVNNENLDITKAPYFDKCLEDKLFCVNGTRLNNETGEEERMLTGFNARLVDVAAPGNKIPAIGIDGEWYNSFSGNSAAQPFVTALAGLLKEKGMTPPQIERIIEKTAVRLPSLIGKIKTGRIDAGAALACADDPNHGCQIERQFLPTILLNWPPPPPEPEVIEHMCNIEFVGGLSPCWVEKSRASWVPNDTHPGGEGGSVILYGTNDPDTTDGTIMSSRTFDLQNDGSVYIHIKWPGVILQAHGKETTAENINPAAYAASIVIEAVIEDESGNVIASEEIARFDRPTDESLLNKWLSLEVRTVRKDILGGGPVKLRVRVESNTAFFHGKIDRVGLQETR